jgi:hypothetical protein
MSADGHSRKIPPLARKFLGKPSLMLGESLADYEELVGLVVSDVNPRHLQEWLLTRDIVVAEWEVLRLRGLKVSMLHAMLPGVTHSLIWGAASSPPMMMRASDPPMKDRRLS